jgi:hypothetical protein
MAMKNVPSHFKFKRNEVIGQPAAEEDHEFLADCFEETGDLEALRDVINPKCLVVGRTGAGKTALLLRAKTTLEHSVLLDLEDLALSYLTNSTILKKLHDLDVKLDSFFKVLWKHIFIIELIRLKYPMASESDKVSFLSWWRNHFGSDRAKDRALKYLDEHKDTFFDPTKVRIKEITEKFESRVQDNMGINAKIFSIKSDDLQTMTVEQKAEVVHQAQEIVNQSQLHELNTLFALLKEDVFSSAQPGYFILVDRLDESWVEDMFRYRLIRALLDTVKDFGKICGVKVVVAIRKDLIERVFNQTKDPGTQREKYQSLYLSLTWDREHLISLLNKRVNALVGRRYHTAVVTYADLLPEAVGDVAIDSYLVDRTLYRPRDIITFFNACIEQAVDQPEISVAILKEAEMEYSGARLRAICDEWRADYPDLENFTSLLKGQAATFSVEKLDIDKIGEYCLNHTAASNRSEGKTTKYAAQVADGEMTVEAFRRHLLSIFYRVGLVGLKIDKRESVRWSFLQGAEIPAEVIQDDFSVLITPAFYRVFGVNPPKTRSQN